MNPKRPIPLPEAIEVTDKVCNPEQPLDISWLRECISEAIERERQKLFAIKYDSRVTEAVLERIAELDDKLAAKQEALEKFGFHKNNCKLAHAIAFKDKKFHHKYRCTCGFTEAKEKSNG